MYDEQEVLEEFERRFSGQLVPFFDSFEELLTHPEGFALTTATNIQLAIARVIGREPIGELWEDPIVRAAFGGVKPEGAYLELLILAAIRCAKSLISVAAGLWFTQKADVSQVRKGEIPRFSICAVEKDNAVAAHLHLRAALKFQERLRVLSIEDPPQEWANLISETKNDFGSSHFVWHPSGVPMEIRVVAGKRAGGSFLSRYSAGAVLDEAPRMVGAGEGVVNYTEMRRGVIARMLPGTMLLSPGSPWQAYGPVYDIFQEEFGVEPRPTSNRCIVKARGPDMNPFYWTEQRVTDTKESDPVAYRTDCQAEFADPEEGLVSPVAVQRCMRADAEPILHKPGREYAAFMDPAFRTNAYTLVIDTKEENNVQQTVFARQWIPEQGNPLKPNTILREISTILQEYGLDSVKTDQYHGESLQSIAEELTPNEDFPAAKPFEIEILDWDAKRKTECYISLGKRIEQGQRSFPADPFISKDLTLAKKKPTARGVSIMLPQTKDGRHCDFVPPLAMAEHYWLPVAADPEEDVVDGSEEYYKRLEQAALEREIAETEDNNWAAWRPFA